MRTRTHGLRVLSALAVIVLMGCGPSRAERQAAEDERAWHENLEQVARSAYTAPASGSRQECLGAMCLTW